MDFANVVVTKKEYAEDTECQIVTAEEPERNGIKEETDEGEEDTFIGTVECCEVKMEEYDWDDQVMNLGHSAMNMSYQGLNRHYLPGEIPLVDSDVLSIPTSPESKEKPYFCNFCDYRTHKTSALAQHVRTHTGEKPFSCHLCNFRSSTSGSLKRHVRRHTGEKPYPCNECEYRGTSASDLQVHTRSHDAGKSFNCDNCDYRGTTSWNLKEHLKTHTGDKPFSCHLCNFKCSASGSLKRHVKRHTGEKPFECEVCNYRCSCSSDLRVHRLIHLPPEDKPFACNICDWRGVTNGQLKVHLKAHRKPEFYECSVCGLKAGRINNLRNHMRTHDRQTDPGEDLNEIVSTEEKDYHSSIQMTLPRRALSLSNTKKSDDVEQGVPVIKNLSASDTTFKNELANDTPPVELMDPS